MERSALRYVPLGKSLRKCRRSIVCSQQDLAACIHSESVWQGIFPPPINGPADLVPVIKELEATGNWTLPHALLYPFVEAAVNCLTPDCPPDLLTELTGFVVQILAADLGLGYTHILNRYLPQQGNLSENVDEEEAADDGGEDDNDTSTD
jgi:hypothetical protein